MYSKFRPHSGDLLIFTAGPNITATSSAWHSLPSAVPISYIRSLSKLDAVAADVGNATASIESYNSAVSDSCFLSP